MSLPHLQFLGQHAHLLPAGVDALEVAAQFAGLVADQEARTARGLPCSPIPLFWIALAQAAGLVVDIESGRIIDGPRAALPVPTRKREGA